MSKDKVLRAEIIWLYYDMSVAGHGEKQKMMKLVTSNYWWPGVTKNVGKYVEGCNMCQRMKNRIEISAEKLKLSKIPEKPQTHLTVDFIMKLPIVAGKDAILVVCDRLSKITHFVATTLVEELARLFRDNM